MAVNYMEDGTRKEPAPINAFHKSPNSIIGPDETMVLPDVPATVFEGEAELAVVIGKKGFNIKAADAMSHVFGYCNFIDGSARGLPPAGNTFYQMKSRETFAPIGPWIVTADEIKDPHKLSVKLWNNGDLKQSFNTSDMAHKIPRCIEFVSSLHTLMPGDILASGTNHRGLHAFQDGNKIELEVEGCGRLVISVADGLKRSWPRETRLQRQEQGPRAARAAAVGQICKGLTCDAAEPSGCRHDPASQRSASSRAGQESAPAGRASRHHAGDDAGQSGWAAAAEGAWPATRQRPDGDRAGRRRRGTAGDGDPRGRMSDDK